MIGFYVGTFAIFVSIHTMKADSGPTPPVSPAMRCVMNLTIQTFAIYYCHFALLLIRHALRDAETYVRRKLEVATNTVQTARHSVELAPMLCVLFVGLRLRALQMTDNKGAPQGWAQQAMNVSTWCVLGQCLAILIYPCFHNMDKEAVVLPDGNLKSTDYFLVALRFIFLLGIYGGAVTVVVAVFLVTPETATGEGSMIPGLHIPAPTN